MNNLSNENSPNGSIVIYDENIPFTAYQAIYNKLTKRTERKSKGYQDYYTVDKSSLKNLHDRLNQTINQYQVRSQRCQVFHAIKNESFREHSSFEKFFLNDCSTKCQSTRLNYEFDFLIVLPPEVPEAADIVQKFKLNITISQFQIDDDSEIFPHYVRSVRFDQPIELSIDYSDFSVCQNLESTVNGWIETLPKRERTKLDRFLYKNENVIRQVIPTSLGLVPLFSGALSYHDITNNSSLISVLLLYATFFIFLKSAGIHLVDVFFKNIEHIRSRNIIMITQGDEIHQNKISSQVKKYSVIALFIFSGIFVNLFMGVTASIIATKILEAWK